MSDEAPRRCDAVEERTLVKLLTIVGLAATAGGVLVGFYWPTVGARWAGEDTPREEARLRLRYAAGVALVVFGTALQIAAAWIQ
jgi:hypothetical protein